MYVCMHVLYKCVYLCVSNFLDMIIINLKI